MLAMPAHTRPLYNLPTARAFLRTGGIRPTGARLTDDLAALLVLHLALTGPRRAEAPTPVALRATLAQDPATLLLTLAHSTITDVRHLMRLLRRIHPAAELRDALTALPHTLAPLVR